MNIGPLASRVVLSLGPHHTLAEAAKRLTQRGVGAAVVATEDGHPGIITERDLLGAVASGQDLETELVGDHMTSEPVCASESWDVAEAAKTMVEGRFRHLIVLDDERQVIGMLSIRDLVEALIEQL